MFRSPKLYISTFTGFNPSVDWHNVDFDNKYAVSIQNQPVTSMVCDPLNEGSVKIIDGKIKLKGYAYSGAGAKIIRVDVTLDKGETWHTAELIQDDSPLNRSWSWSLWEVSVFDYVKSRGLHIMFIGA